MRCTARTAGAVESLMRSRRLAREIEWVRIPGTAAEVLKSEVFMPADPLIENSQPTFLSLAAKTAVCHTLTYLFMGGLAYHFLHYAELITKPCSGMRPMSDPLAMAGPILQPLRGVLFALVFYPLRGSLFGRKHGWLLMGWILIAVGILGTFAAPPGSMEGLIYTTVPVSIQLRGYLEIVPQALLLSALLCYWVNHPGKKWLTWLLGAPFCILMAFFVFVLIVRPAPR
jgi:hypothetical protein